MKDINVKIEGMTCASCASLIEREIQKLEGVKTSSVNFAVATGKFQVDNPDLEKQIKNKISELGYKAINKQESAVLKSENNFQKFIISFILSLAVFSLEMWPLMGWPTHHINWMLQLMLATLIWIWIGNRFQKSLLVFFKTGHSNMNTLIGLGTTSAYLYSAFVTIFHQQSINFGLTQKVYFEAVGFIISFVYLGQYFEDKAKTKTTEALNSLLKIGAKNANLVNGNDVVEIEISKIMIGDILRVRPGEKIPVDGQIIKGHSNIDESMITGEAIPVSKTINDKIYAGTINGESFIDFRAMKIGQDTFLSQIINFVELAQNSKPQIQKFADRISAIFTPVVILISVITFLSWYFFGPEPKWGNAISNLIAVLVIACPCALGLATPTAVVVATGRASQKGILIGGGDVLEKAIGIDTIIFDKTGTLTEGRPSVSECVLDDKILAEVASIEQFSEHPLSKAVVAHAKNKKLDFTEPSSFEIVKGKGILAEINNVNFVIGNLGLLADQGIKLDDQIKTKQIGSIIYIAKDKQHVGTIIIGDKIKDSSKYTIGEFKKRGIQTIMVTGDNAQIALQVSSELSIDSFIAAAMPLDKSKKIEELQMLGKKVAMVGDGVNDAPALAKANLSIAMGTGTDVAINASDVTIIKGDLIKALEFLDLAQQSMKIIKQNLFLSMVYNAVLIPIAAGILVVFSGPMMPPILASMAMGLSSISVVSNSLRAAKI